MNKQEIEFAEIIADDDFRAGGQAIRKGEPYQASKATAKQLVALGKAHYPTAEDRQADEDADTDPTDTAVASQADDDADAPGEKAPDEEVVEPPKPAAPKAPATRKAGK